MKFAWPEIHHFAVWEWGKKVSGGAGSFRGVRLGLTGRGGGVLRARGRSECNQAEHDGNSTDQP